MATLKLVTSTDSNNPNIGDIYIDANSGTDRLTTTLAEEVQQELLTRFRFFQGEWFLDATVGTPYYQSILGQKVPLNVVSQIFKQVISSTPGVARLLSFNLTKLPARGVQCQFACELNNGQILKSTDFTPFVIGTLVFGGA
jgi:hypothetical protein